MNAVTQPIIDHELAERAAKMVNYETGMISREIFMSEEIFKLELEHVFRRCWLFLCHESQIPNPNDYMNVKMGLDSVLVCRDRDGKIQAFINSCRHRGVPVCRSDMGNARTFICPYHGWTYDTTGALVHMPGEDTLYFHQTDRKDWGLPKVAKVASYGGLVFGTFDPDAPSLDDYLGEMRWGLDLLLGQGELTVVPGVARWVMDANWKFAADNAIGDMYHGFYTHRSAAMAGHASGTGTNKRRNMVPPDKNTRPGMTVVTEYGHGFTANLIDPNEVDLNSHLAAWRKRPELHARVGDVGVSINRANMNVFPNLFVNSGSRELMLRNPLSPTKLEIWKFVLVDKNAPPETVRGLVRASNRHFGPAGMFEQDDGENWDQSTQGAIAPVTRRDDLNYSMGLGLGKIIKEPGVPAHIKSLVNEYAQLWMYRCWAEFMKAPDWDYLKKHHSRPEGVL